VARLARAERAPAFGIADRAAAQAAAPERLLSFFDRRIIRPASVRHVAEMMLMFPLTGAHCTAMHIIAAHFAS